MENTVTGSEATAGMTAREAFESVIAERRGRLVATATSILRNADAAEDVVQETLLRCWRAVERGDVEDLGGYVARAVYWNALKARARRVSRAELDDRALSRAGAVDESGAAHRLEPFELERAIAELPVTQQTVVRLRFYMGLTFAEISRSLSISLNTAASRSRYALNHLRAALNPGAGGERDGAKR